MNIVLNGFCGYVALAVIIFCIVYTMVRAGIDLHDQWVWRKWKKNNIDKQQLIDKACEYLYDWNKKQVEKHGSKTILSIREFTISVSDFRKAMED